MTAVAVWDHLPTPQELLEARIARGWKPTPSAMRDGDQILGCAACLWSPANVNAPGEEKHSAP
jgi:hypothetical protein